MVSKIKDKLTFKSVTTQDLKNVHLTLLMVFLFGVNRFHILLLPGWQQQENGMRGT